MSQLLQWNDSFVAGENRREGYCRSVECEGSYFVVGAFHDDAITFEGKLVVDFYLLDACRCTISEGGNLPQFVTCGRGSGSHGHLVISEGYFR